MIRTNNLWKKFNFRPALRGVTLDVAVGGATALIGSNGAGKSTLIRVLMNLLTPSLGSAEVLGVDSRRLAPRELAQIGYVAEAHVFSQWLRVHEYIAYVRAFYPQWDLDLEKSVVAQLSLPLQPRIRELSHGQRLKVGLACALPYRPKVMLLDEPLSGLDPLVRDDVMATLAAQAGETTILISSQELGEIETLATNVALLDAGQLMFNESMDSLTQRFREVRVTLDRPAVTPAARSEWLEIKAAGNVITFVDTQFDEAEFGDRVRAAVGDARHIDAAAMPLRSIFTTLARAKREGVRA